MDDQRRSDIVYSNRVRAGKRRTYFFDVRETKGGDFFLTLTESTRMFHGDGYKKHKIFLYKEDFNRFLSGLEDAITHVKTELMPDYDYDEFTRRHEEWEAQRAAELEAEKAEESSGESKLEKLEKLEEVEKVEKVKEEEDSEVETEDDMTW